MEVIRINGKKYQKFIRLPDPVTDGSIRCIFCGQIDEPEYHENALCCACEEWIDPASPETPEQGKGK